MWRVLVAISVVIVLQGDDLTAPTTRVTLPLPEAYAAEAPRKITAEEREFDAFRTLRVARANQRHEGARKVRQAKVSRYCLASLCCLTLPTER